MSEPVGEAFDRKYMLERYSYGWREYRMNSALAGEEVNFWPPLEDRALIDFIGLVQGDGQ